MSKRNIIVFILSLLSVSTVFGQTMTCGETLEESKRLFAQGSFYNIPKLLKPCIDNGFNSQQRIDAYFLLTQTYLFLDDPIAAEDSYLKLLYEDPEFRPDKDLDPIDVVYLSEKFTTRPIFVFTSRVGINYTSTDVIQPFNTSDTPLQAIYTNGFALEAGLGGEVVISDYVSIGAELNILQKKYNYEQLMFGDDQQTMTENQWNFEIPLLARVRWEMGKISPYVYGGPSVNYLFSAVGDIQLIDRLKEVTADEITSEVPVNGPPVNLHAQREKINFNAVVGAGLLLKFKYNYISFDLRYRAGLNNVVNIDEQYSNNELLYRYGYVDDYKRLNNLVLTVGFVKPFYKPRKRKNFK